MEAYGLKRFGTFLREISQEVNEGEISGISMVSARMQLVGINIEKARTA